MSKPLISAEIVAFSAKYGVPIRYIADLFIVTLKEGSLLNKEVIQITGLSLQAITLIKKELSIYFEKLTGQVMLTDLGKKAAQALSDFDDKQIGINSDEMENSDLYKVINDIRNRSEVHDKREYDQFPATAPTIVNRALFMSKQFDLSGKRVLLLGDDDYTSVAIGLMDQSTEITVLEVDEAVISAIKKHAADYNLSIKIVKGDLRENLPNNLKSQFDVVFTDPPYTEEGIKLFLSRAIQSMDIHNKAGRIYFCYGNSELAREKYLKIQKVVGDSGLMLRFSLDKFNSYNGAESIGSTSNLYVCDITSSSDPLVKGQYNGKSIYTHQN